MPTRRQVLRVGLAGSAYLLGVGYVIGPGRRRRAFADDDEGEALPSPPTTPFLEELPIASIAQEEAPFPISPDPSNCVNVDGTTAFHVGFHGPQPLPGNTKFFLIHESAALHS